MTEEIKSKSVRIDARLVAGMSKEDRDMFLISFGNCKITREILSEHLTKEIDRVIIESESIKIYESPNALATLADLQGYRRALRFCQKLINPEDSK